MLLVVTVLTAFITNSGVAQARHPAEANPAAHTDVVLTAIASRGERGYQVTTEECPGWKTTPIISSSRAPAGISPAEYDIPAHVDEAVSDIVDRIKR